MRENLVELGDLVARRGHPPPATARIAEDGICEKDGSLVATDRWHEYIVSNVGWAASSYPQKLGVSMAEIRRTFINLVLEYAEVNQLQCALTEENSESEGEEAEGGEEGGDGSLKSKADGESSDADSDSVPTQKCQSL